MKKAEELAEGEQLIMMARSRWSSYILPALALAAYVGVWLYARSADEDTWTFRILMLGAGIWGVRFFARRLSTYLMLTDRRIYGEAGVLVTRTLDVPLDRVGGVYVEKNPLGKITGRGTVTITTSGSRFEFPCIPSANKFRDALMRQLELTRAAGERKQADALAAAIARAFRDRDSRRVRRGGGSF